MGYTDNLRTLLSADYSQYKLPDGEPAFEDFQDFSETIANIQDSFRRYFDAVVEGAVTIAVASEALRDGAFSTQQYQYEVQTVDRQRRTAHESAIDAANQLNRICERVGIEPICNVDTKDREAVHQFVFEAVSDLYLTETERVRAKDFAEYIYDNEEIRRSANTIGQMRADAITKDLVDHLQEDNTKVVEDEYDRQMVQYGKYVSSDKVEPSVNILEAYQGKESPGIDEWER